jgi:hypothetical protein
MIQKALWHGFLIFIFLFLWQGVVGVLIAIESSSGFVDGGAICIDPVSLRGDIAPMPTVDTSLQVPVIQIWRDSNTSTYTLGSSRAEKWRSLCESGGIPCLYSLITDADVEAMLQAPEYAREKRVYRALPPGVKRADFSRLLLLQARGGIYVDLDVEMGQFPLHLIQLLASRDVDNMFDCIIPLNGAGNGVSNHFLACSAPKSPFLSHALEQLSVRILNQGWWRRFFILPYIDVLSACGPVFLSGAVRSYAASAAKGAPCVAIVPPASADRWLGHGVGRSWVGQDGHFILGLSDGGEEVVGMLMVAARLFLVCASLATSFSVFKCRRTLTYRTD